MGIGYGRSMFRRVHEDDDVQRLYGLLSVLPPLDGDDPSPYWRDYAAAVPKPVPQVEPLTASYIGQRIPYLLRSVAGGTVTRFGLEDLARLTLQFYAVGDDPRLCGLLDDVVRVSNPVAGAVGRVWVSAVTDAAIRCTHATPNVGRTSPTPTGRRRSTAPRMSGGAGARRWSVVSPPASSWPAC